MNINLLNSICHQEQLFTPELFTKKQVKVIKKKLLYKKLTPAETKAYSASIKKKIQALQLINQEWFIRGNPLTERVELAKEIIKEYTNKEVFIGGSFLFKEKYNDIDIYIIDNKYNETHKNKYHIIRLPRRMLADPVFQIASNCSVSNFNTITPVIKKKPSLSQVIGTFQEAIIEQHENAKKREATRQLYVWYNLFVNNKIPSSNEIHQNNQDSTIWCKELVKKLFSKSYTYVFLVDFVKHTKKAAQHLLKKDHLLELIKVCQEMIH